MRNLKLTVAALTVMSHAAAIALFLAINALLHFEVTNFFTLLIVPLGAVTFGLVGSIGAGFGLRWTGTSPEAPLLNYLIGAAIFSFMIYLLILAELTSRSSSGEVGLLQSLIGNIVNTELIYGRAGQQDGSLGLVGGWGFVLLGLKLAGTAGGAYVAYEGMLFRNQRRQRSSGDHFE
jgi:hypothetical protein